MAENGEFAGRFEIVVVSHGRVDDEYFEFTATTDWRTMSQFPVLPVMFSAAKAMLELLAAISEERAGDMDREGDAVRARAAREAKVLAETLSGMITAGIARIEGRQN